MALKLGKHGLFLGGLLGLSYGCWLIYHPLGWIVAGLLLVGISFLFDKLAE